MSHDNGSEDPPDDVEIDTTRSITDLVESGELDTASNVLLLGPMEGLRRENTCVPFFRVPPVEDKNVLFVSLTRSADDRLQLLKKYGNGFPKNVGVVAIGEQVSSSTTETGPSDDASNVTIKTLSDPSDLPKLGMTISNFVEEWKADDQDTIVCFHSVSVLLQYAELQRVFRFLHILMGQFKSAGGTAHFHMNSDAHDRQTIATLHELFDAVVEFDEGGEVTIR